MLIVKTADGAVFEADTARAVVSQMRRDNWNAPDRKLEYMEEVAERVQAATEGADVRVDTPAHFLGDLERAGWIQVSVNVTLPASLVALAVDAARAARMEPLADLGELADLLEPWAVQAGRAEEA